MKPATDNPEVRDLEDAAWNVKDCAADLFGRPLSDSDRAVLASVQRDLERLHERLIEVRDRRRRKRSNGAAEPEPANDSMPVEPA
jgi:hypothetical protein